VYYIWDKYDLLKEKDSPADASNKIFEYLMKYKIKYDENEHKEYLKSFKKKDGV
jgi:DNA primase